MAWVNSIQFNNSTTLTVHFQKAVGISLIRNNNGPRNFLGVPRKEQEDRRKKLTYVDIVFPICYVPFKLPQVDQ